MIIKVRELCEVEYIKETDEHTEEPQYAVRTVTYESDKESLVEAFSEYMSEDFDIDRVIECEDEFDGGCDNTVKILSVEELNED